MPEHIDILYISYDGATDPLGQSQIIPYLKEISRRRGVRYLLVTHDKAPQRRKAAFSSLRRELKEAGISWVSLNYHKNPKVIAKIYDISCGFFTCFALVIKHRIKLIHGRSFVGAFIGMLLKKLFRVKFLLDYRGLWADERVDGSLWPRGGFLYKISKYIERLLIESADEIVVLTKMAQRAIEDFDYLSKKKITIEVIPTCVDIKRFGGRNEIPAPQQENRLTLLYLGSLGTWYMLDEMIDFFIELRNEFEGSDFLLVTPAEEDLIKSAMLKKNIPDSRYCVKNVPYRDVPEMLMAADLSIMFIKPLFSKISSCPTKFGESLSCGIPVVINYGIGDCDEIVKTNRVGVVIDSFNGDAYRNAIRDLKNILSRKQELKNRCRAVAADSFSLDRGARSYYEIYSRLGIGEGAL